MFDLNGIKMEGIMPRKQRKLVEAWVLIHADELAAEWELVRADEPLARIEPLR